MKITNQLVPECSPFEILLMRNFLTLFVFIGISVKTNQSLTDFKGSFWIVMFWAISSIISFTLYLYALKYISATKVNLIGNCHPILAMSFAYFLLKENISNFDKISIWISLAGILLIIQNNTRFVSDKPDPEMGYLFAGLQWCLFATTSVGLRIINQNLNWMMVPFYFSVMSVIIFSTMYFFDSSLIDYSKYSHTALIIIVVYTLLSIAGQVSTNLAFKYAQASELAPLWNFSIVLNFMFEWLALGYDFKVTDFLGTFVMIWSFLSPIILRKLWVNYSK